MVEHVTNVVKRAILQDSSSPESTKCYLEKNKNDQLSGEHKPKKPRGIDKSKWFG